MKSFLCSIILLLNKVYSNDNIKSTQVEGAHEVNPQFKYTFMVSLQMKGTHFCGGALVAQSVILSAAHCIPPLKNETIEAVLHRHDLGVSNELENGTSHIIKEYITHPEYKRDYFLNDLAIWKIDSKVALYYTISPNKDDQSLPNNLVAKVVGWGISDADQNANKLLETKVSFKDDHLCYSNSYTSGPTFNSKKQLCAGFPGNNYSGCENNPVGPLFVNTKGKNVLVGFASQGVSCPQTNQLDIYTRVSSYNDWIFKYF